MKPHASLLLQVLPDLWNSTPKDSTDNDRPSCLLQGEVIVIVSKLLEVRNLFMLAHESV